MIWPDFNPNLRSQRPVTSIETTSPPARPVNRTIDAGGAESNSTSFSSVSPPPSSLMITFAAKVTAQDAFGLRSGSDDQ